MIVILSYITITILLLVVIFFLLRTSIIAFSMLTEVPYLPSGKLFKKAVEYLDIEEGDKVLDIGSGDGRVLIYASKIYPNTEFLGIERNFLLVIYSNFLKIILGRKNLKFKCVDAYNFDISKFNKIYIYLLPVFTDKILLKNKEKFRNGVTIVSFHYPFGKKFTTINNPTKYPVKYNNRRDYIYKWTKK